MNGISRGRNIFARTYEPLKHAWSTEVEVSPHELATAGDLLLLAGLSARRVGLGKERLLC